MPDYSAAFTERVPPSRSAPVCVFDHLRIVRKVVLLVDGSLTMFAVIRTGGKQYRVAQDQFVTVERLDAEPGASVTLEEVLMLGGGDTAIQIGTPVIAGASVTAEVVEQTRGPKIIIFKKKRRQNYRRKKGHRQDLTVLKITAIAGA